MHRPNSTMRRTYVYVREFRSRRLPDRVTRRTPPSRTHTAERHRTHTIPAHLHRNLLCQPKVGAVSTRSLRLPLASSRLGNLQVFSPQHGLIGKIRECTFDDVLQLAHVARKALFEQHRERIRREHRRIPTSREVAQEMPREHWHVRASLA